MAKVNDLIKKAEAEIGNTKRRVLLVEGEDDRQAIEAFLNKRSPLWANHWIVFPSGKKSNVLDILQNRTDWLGLVDRDEWTEETIQQKQQNLANLCVLPRFCIENYLVRPQELWSALPIKQQAQISGGSASFNTEIMTKLPEWLVHGVLWSVVNPLWQGMQERRFNKGLLDVQSANDRAFIEKKLKEWHDYLEPNGIIQQLDERLAKAQNESTEEQLKKWVHGKQFFESVIDPFLNQHLGQMKQGTRQKKIFEHLPVPDDLDFLWIAMEM